jgi:hypothetical protein
MKLATIALDGTEKKWHHLCHLALPTRVSSLKTEMGVGAWAQSSM